jgi:hypothetical protein
LATGELCLEFGVEHDGFSFSRRHRHVSRRERFCYSQHIAFGDCPIVQVLTVAQAVAIENGQLIVTIPQGDTVKITDTAANLETLTPTEIASLHGLKVIALVATDHDVTFTPSQDAALGGAAVVLTEPFGTNGTQTISWNGDGSTHDIHYFGVTGQPYTDVDVFYGPNHKLASETFSNGMIETFSYNLDGSLHEVVETGITGQRWTSTDILYGLGNKPASETWTNGAALIQTETWNPDGTTHDIHNYGITGKPYTDFDVLYGPNDKPASATYSNGMTQTWTYNLDVAPRHRVCRDHRQAVCGDRHRLRCRDRQAGGRNIHQYQRDGIIAGACQRADIRDGSLGGQCDHGGRSGLRLSGQRQHDVGGRRIERDIRVRGEFRQCHDHRLHSQCAP